MCASPKSWSKYTTLVRFSQFQKCESVPRNCACFQKWQEMTWGNTFELNDEWTGSTIISGTQQSFSLSLPLGWPQKWHTIRAGQFPFPVHFTDILAFSPSSLAYDVLSIFIDLCWTPGLGSYVHKICATVEKSLLVDEWNNARFCLIAFLFNYKAVFNFFFCWGYQGLNE